MQRRVIYLQSQKANNSGQKSSSIQGPTADNDINIIQVNYQNSVLEPMEIMEIHEFSR